MTSVGADQAVTSDRLLLVEGQDEKNLSAAMLAHWDIRGVQVVAVGGKDGFAPGLEALMLAAEAGGRPPFAIGVMRDADDSPDSALQSVTSALRVAGLATPDSHGAFAPGPPSVGVFILPDGESQGAIEDLCWASVEDTSAARCSADYLECLRGAAALRSKNAAKTLVHAYLAAQEEPYARAGEGALKGYWPFDHPAFAPLKEFARHVASGERPRDARERDSE